MQAEGVTPLSRLDIKNPSRAQTVVDNLYRDVERRITASPPGLCPVDMSLSFLQLCHAQSCGKCVPCRIGLGQLSKLIATVLDGTADMGTLAIIEKTARTVVNTADCAIGRDAARLVLDGLEGFRDDYEEHILHHRCLAGLQLPVPCVALCPAGVDVPGYMALIGEGRCADAVRLIRKDNPFPVACAYICEHPCEARCRRNMIDDAINIRGLKRYAVDTAGDVAQPPCAPPTGKKVAIIGGGPSGMEAARVAALRGHRVELWDDRPRLGGRLRLAAVPPHKARYGEACDYLEREIRKLGVDIHLNAAVTEVELDSRKPDAVILATGSVPFVPPIQGLSGGGAVLVDDVLEGRAPVGRRVAIIGGGAIGAETAHLLVEEEDREVYLIEMRDGIAVDLPQDARICLLHAFEQTPSLHQITNAKVTAVTPESITLERQGQTEVVDRLDTIILAVGARPNQGLRPALEALGIPFLVSGDATGPKDYVKAIYEGFVAGNTIAE